MSDALLQLAASAASKGGARLVKAVIAQFDGLLESIRQLGVPTSPEEAVVWACRVATLVVFFWYNVLSLVWTVTYAAISWMYYLSPLHTYVQQRELLLAEKNKKQLEEKNAELAEASLQQKEELVRAEASKKELEAKNANLTERLEEVVAQELQMKRKQELKHKQELMRKDKENSDLAERLQAVEAEMAALKAAKSAEAVVLE